jgi:AraC-like DNA-binding protein
MLVVALVRTPDRRARLIEALRERAVVQFCDLVEELRALVMQPRVQAAIVEPRDRDGTSTAPAVAATKQNFPLLPVVGYVAAGEDVSRDVIVLARAGIDDLLIFDASDSRHAIREVVSTSRTLCCAMWAMAELAPLVPEALRGVVEYCLTNAARSLTVPEVARAYGLHRKTLANRFAQALLPPPSTFISWCRLLAAADLLVDGDRPLEHVALDLDFPSAGALRALLKRCLGIRVLQLRTFGGGRYVLDGLKYAIQRSLSQAAGEESFGPKLLAG